MLDVQLGPLAFTTLREPVVDQLGDGLETVGHVVRPGERRPRPLKLVLPVHGPDGEELSYEAGVMLRRQARALMENSAMKLQGLYFTWSVDPEMDGWMLVSTADIEDESAGSGATFAEWKLTVEGYRVATLAHPS